MHKKGPRAAKKKVQKLKKLGQDAQPLRGKNPKVNIITCFKKKKKKDIVFLVFLNFFEFTNF